MKLEVGMYVRTDKGVIEKINSLVIQESNPLFPYTINCRARFGNEIVKASHNIIDLIEVGDYVNGILVEKIWEKQEDCIFFNTIDEEIMIQVTNKAVESIVTKEQFELMSYKVSE